MTLAAKTEDRATYLVGKAIPINTAVIAAHDAVIDHALRIIASRLRVPGETFGSPGVVGDYLKLRLAALEYESFTVLFLDTQNRFIECEELFRGTLTQTSVYTREVVKAALRHNAAGMILAHNHPSGVCEPSGADQRLTTELKKALVMVDVRVLDHLIVGGMETYSFAEHGLM